MKLWYYIWVVAEGLLILAVLSLWLVAPEEIVLNLSASVFATLLGLLLFYPYRAGLIKWFKSSHFKSLLSNLLGYGLCTAIVALLCYLSWKFPWRVDLTEDSLNTLTVQSRQVMQDLPADTKLTLFAKREDWPGMMGLLRLYREARADLKLEAIDPEVNPQKARSLGVQENGTVVIEAAGKTLNFVIRDELSVTNALIKLIRPHAIQVFLTQGHGEPTCDMTGPGGISAFCGHLKSQNFQIQNLDLQTSQDVPATADLVIIWGPTSGFLPQEMARLQRWLEKGGSLLVMISPDFAGDAVAEVRGLIKRWGLQLANDLVIDRISTLETQEATIPLVDKYDTNHPITKNFKLRTLFPLSSSVESVQPLYEGVVVTPLAMTSAYPGSWAEKNLKAVSLGKANFDEGVDLKGPVPLVAVAERLTEAVGEKDTRIGAIGNDSFTRNAYQNQTANMNFLLNLVGWLSHDEGLVSLNRPGLSHTPVVLSAQHLRFVFASTVLAFPLVCFLIAIIVYRRRRQL